MEDAETTKDQLRATRIAQEVGALLFALEDRGRANPLRNSPSGPRLFRAARGDIQAHAKMWGETSAAAIRKPCS